MSVLECAATWRQAGNTNAVHTKAVNTNLRCHPALCLLPIAAASALQGGCSGDRLGKAARQVLQLPIMTAGQWGDGTKPVSVIDLCVTRPLPRGYLATSLTSDRIAPFPPNVYKYYS